MSILSKAKAIPAQTHNRSEASQELMEAAVAYAKHEVTMKQIAKALGISPPAAQSRITHALFSAVRTGYLK